jgi:hypothetical protein
LSELGLGEIIGIDGIDKMMSDTDYFVRCQQTLHYNISFQLTRNDGAPEEEVVFTIQQYSTEVNDPNHHGDPSLREIV